MHRRTYTLPKYALSIKRSTLSAVERYELNQWLEEHRVSTYNLRRSFTDVQPLARILSRYYPEIVDLNIYPPVNSVHNKVCNWETFNRRVLAKLGLQLTREQMIRVARSVPGSVDQLLYSVMRVHRAAEEKALEEHVSTEEEDEPAAEALEPDEAKPTDRKQLTLPLPVPLPRTLSFSLTHSGRHTDFDVSKLIPTAYAVRSLRKVASATPTTSTSKKRSSPSRGGIPTGASSSGRSGRNKRQLLNRRSYTKTNTGELPSTASSATGGAMPEEAEAGPHTSATASRHRGEQVNVKPKQRMVLYSVYMQAVKQLERRNARIARFDQWSAHLENMLQLKCERIDELQRQVAVAMLANRQLNRRSRHKKRQVPTTIAGMLEAAKRL